MRKTTPNRPSIATKEDASATGDFRGPYGYAHRAHKSDPGGTYTFHRDVVPVLPTRRRKRKTPATPESV